MKLATLSVTPPHLALMLGLPQSTKIHRVIWDAKEKLVRIIVEHPLLPEHDGGDGPLPPAASLITKTEYASLVLDGGSSETRGTPQ